jgi:hypothetical protein
VWRISRAAREGNSGDDLWPPDPEEFKKGLLARGPGPNNPTLGPAWEDGSGAVEANLRTWDAPFKPGGTTSSLARVGAGASDGPTRCTGGPSIIGTAAALGWLCP